MPPRTPAAGRTFSGRRARRARATRGFTLIELVVTFVILAILAAIGFATYDAVNRNSRGASAETNLAAVVQGSEGLVSADGRAAFRPDDVRASISDLTAAARGVQAAGGSSAWVGVSGPSTRYREVSYGIASSKPRPAPPGAVPPLPIPAMPDHAVGLATVTPTGGCAFAYAEIGQRTDTWHVDTPLGANCSAQTALTQNRNPAAATGAVPGPVNPASASSSPGSNTITVNWTAPLTTPTQGAPSGYRVFLANTSQVLTPDPGTATTVAITEAPTGKPLVSGTPYSFEIAAYNTAGEGPHTTVTATPQGPPQPVQGFVGTPGDTVVTLTWAPNQERNLTGYTVTRTGPGAAKTFPSVAPSAPLKVRDTGLTDGTTYTYSIVATGPGGTSTASTATATPGAVPNPPATLTGSPGDGQNDLAWTPPAAGPALTGYHLYLTGTATPISSVSPPKPLTFTHLGLRNGKRYTYTVTAYNQYGQSAPTGPLTLVPSGGPSAPTGLAARPGNAQITLTWNPSPDSGLQNYRLYRDGAPIASIPAGTETYLDSGLTNGQPYTYTIDLLVNSGKASPQSGPVTATPTGPLQPARSLVGTPGVAQVRLDWQGPVSGNPSGYKVIQDGALVATVTARTANITGLNPNQSYAFAVIATYPTGDAGPSNTVTVTPQGIPGPPTGLKTVRGDTTLALSWVAPAGSAPDGYNVYSAPAGQAPTFVTSTPAGTTSYTLTGLRNFQDYDLLVSAYNIAGESPKASITDFPGLAPDAPILAPPSRGDREISLTWSMPSPPKGSVAQGFRVFRDGAQIADITTLSYKDANLTNFVSHDYTVLAYNRAGLSPQSNKIFATPYTAPTSVTSTPSKAQVNSPSQTPFSDSKLVISWTAPSGSPSGYRVYVDGASAQYGPDIAPGTTSVTVTGLSNFVEHNVLVKAFGGTTDPVVSQPGGPGTGTPRMPVSNLTATPSRLGAPGTVKLTWTEPTGKPSGYHVFVDGVNTTTATAPATSVVVPNVTLWDSHTFMVQAYSATATADSPTVTAAPSTPVTGLVAKPTTNVDPGTITLTWNPAYTPGTPTGYHVFEDGAAAPVATLPFGTNTTSFVRPVFRTHTYTVTAYSAAVPDSDPSNVAGATNSAPPTGLTVSPSTPASPPAAFADGFLDLSWTAAPGPLTGYYVYRGGVKVGTVPAGTTTFRAIGLTNFNQYSFTVSAYGGTAPYVGESDQTPPTTGTARAPVTNLLAAPSRTGNPGTVTLTWVEPSGNPTGYKVFRDSPAGPLLATVPKGTTSATVPAPQLWTKYDYYVQAYSPTATATLLAAPKAPATSSATSVQVTGLTALPTNPPGTQGGVPNGTVRLTWTPVPTPGTPTGYRIYQDGVAQTTVPFGTNTIDLARPPFVTHAYTVTAYSPDVEGDPSAPASATPSAPPTGLTVSPAGMDSPPASFANGFLDLSWTAPAGSPTGYYVYQSGTKIATVTSGTSYRVPSLTNFNPYTFTVSAYGGSAPYVVESNQSASATGTPRAPVTITSSTPSRTTNPGTVGLTWAEPAGNQTGYKVYLDGGLVGTVLKGTTSFTVANVSAWVDHTFQVQAYSATATASAYVVRAPNTPVPTVSTAGHTSGPGTIDVNWTAAPGNPPNYKIYVDGGAPFVVGNQTSASVSASSFVSHSVEVAGYNPGLSNAADQTSDLVSGPPATPATEPSYINSSYNGTDGQILVTWGAATNCTSGTSCTYRIYRDNNFATPYTSVASNGAGSQSFTDSGLSHGQVYTYHVDATGGSAPVGTSVKTGPTSLAGCYKPTQVTGVYTTGTTVNSISIAWPGAARATDYYVYRDGGYVGNTGGATSFTDNGLTPGTYYNYTVTAADACGTAPPSAPHSETTVNPPPNPPVVSCASFADRNTTLRAGVSSGGGSVTSYNLYSSAGTLATNYNGATGDYAGFAPGTQYSFYATANGPGGTSTNSSPVYCTTPPGGTIPQQIKESLATNVRDVNIVWGGVTGATSYEIYKGGAFYTSTGGTSATVSYSNTQENYGAGQTNPTGAFNSAGIITVKAVNSANAGSGYFAGDPSAADCQKWCETAPNGANTSSLYASGTVRGITWTKSGEVRDSLDAGSQSDYTAYDRLGNNPFPKSQTYTGGGPYSLGWVLSPGWCVHSVVRDSWTNRQSQNSTEIIGCLQTNTPSATKNGTNVDVSWTPPGTYGAPQSGSYSNGDPGYFVVYHNNATTGSSANPSTFPCGGGSYTIRTADSGGNGTAFSGAVTSPC